MEKDALACCVPQEAAQLLLLRTTAVHQGASGSGSTAADAHGRTGRARSCEGKSAKRKRSVVCTDSTSLMPTVTAAVGAAGLVGHDSCALSHGAVGRAAGTKKRKTRHQKMGPKPDSPRSAIADPTAAAASADVLGSAPSEVEVEADLFASGLVEYSIWANFVPNVVSFSTVLNCCTKLVSALARLLLPPENLALKTRG